MTNINPPRVDVRPTGLNKGGEFFKGAPLTFSVDISLPPKTADTVLTEVDQAPLTWEVDFKRFFITQVSRDILWDPKVGRSESTGLEMRNIYNFANC